MTERRIGNGLNRPDNGKRAGVWAHTLEQEGFAFISAIRHRAGLIAPEPPNALTLFIGISALR
jgi:hypothetical protein